MIKHLVVCLKWALGFTFVIFHLQVQWWLGSNFPGVLRLSTSPLSVSSSPLKSQCPFWNWQCPNVSVYCLSALVGWHVTIVLRWLPFVRTRAHFLPLRFVVTISLWYLLVSFSLIGRRYWYSCVISWPINRGKKAALMCFFTVADHITFCIIIAMKTTIRAECEDHWCANMCMLDYELIIITSACPCLS